jgi:hypothetical protein
MIDYISKIEALIKEKIKFNRNNEQECLNAIEENSYCISYIKNPSEEVQLEAVKQDGYSVGYIKDPSIEVQKTAIYSSGCNLAIIAMCPNWEEFADELYNNLIIKDIIE